VREYKSNVRYGSLRTQRVRHSKTNETTSLMLSRPTAASSKPSENEQRAITLTITSYVYFAR